MIYITKLHIENYRCFETFDIDFQKNVNIIVGNNETGKSTILEAINLCLSGLLHGRYLKNELTEYLFNATAVKNYVQAINEKKPIEPPHILVEVYLDSDNKNDPLLAELKGTGNTEGGEHVGIRLEILFDERFQSEYGVFIEDNISNLPIEYYTIQWSSFARDNSITARSIPLKPNMIDSSSTAPQETTDI